MIRISPGPPLDESGVLALEAAVESWLPPDYRRFLRASNGGEPEPNTVLHPDGNIGSVRRFFSLGRGDLYDIQVYRARGVPLPPQLLAIAEDDFGNPYCVEFTTGRVYYWDRELEGYEDDVDHPSMRPALEVADSFDGFVSRLSPDTDS